MNLLKQCAKMNKYEKIRVKASAEDFLPTQLPQTRKDQFFFIVKNQYLSLLLIGFILVLCLLPFIVTAYFKARFEIGFYQLFQAGELSQEDYNSSINVLMLYASGIELLLTFVLSIGISGTNRIIKLMVSGEGVIFKRDFIYGIKQNYLNTSLLMFIFGVILVLCRFVSAFFLEYMLGIPFYILLILLVIPVFMLAGVFSSCYDGNVFQCIGNSVKLYSAYWWKYLLMSLAIFTVIYGLTYLEIIPILMAGIHIVLAVLVLPLYLLVLFEISLSCFDKYINRENFPDDYNAGLYKPVSK